MNLSDWIAEAHSDEVNNLCEFNYERDKIGGVREWGDESRVREAFSRFEGFLAAKSADPSTDHCANLLSSFSKQDIQDNESNAAAYLGMGTEGIHRFVALKNLVFVEKNGKYFGYTSLECTKIATTLNTKMTYKSYDFNLSGELNAAARKMMDATLKQAVENSKDTASMIAMARSPSLPSGAIALTPPSATENWEPIWVTANSSVDALGPVPNTDESQRVRSAYVAGMKDHLGLSNPSDTQSDRDFGGGVYERTARFRMKVLLEMELKPGDSAPRQPCLFSLGDKAIYVSRREPKSPAAGIATMPGRTVHLEDRSCSHPANCGCNGPGLPEAIMPETSFLRQQPSLLAQAVLFERDLRHQIGPTNSIRLKNPV